MGLSGRYPVLRGRRCRCVPKHLRIAPKLRAESCYTQVAFDVPHSLAEIPIQPRIARHQMQGDHLKNIFIGNLDFGATEESIRTLFEGHGAVERVSLITNRDTGRSRGFAFVEMTDSGQADQAIAALHGTSSGGRALNVSETRPKKTAGGAPHEHPPHQ